MRVLFLSPSASFGGSEKAMFGFLRELTRLKPEWSARVVLSGHGLWEEQLAGLGIKFRVLPFPSSLTGLGDFGLKRSGWGFRLRWLAACLAALPGIARYVRSLKKEIASFVPDIIYTGSFKMHVLAVWAAPRRCPLVANCQDVVSSRPLMSRFFYLYARRFRMIIGCAEHVRRDIERVTAGRTVVKCVYNGIDPAEFRSEGRRLDLDKASGMAAAPSQTVRIGFVATFARWKGHDLFFKALSLLDTGLSWRAYVIGGPIYKTKASQWQMSELKELALRYGIIERVGFTGLVSDVAAAYRSLDIAVQASLEPEPFGLSLVEAMACARTVVAPDHGGPREIITPGHDGVLFVPNDAKSLSTLLGELIVDDRRRLQLGEAARGTAGDKFTTAHMAQEILRLWGEADLIGTS
jgi:glycosyltransferase involved in cell wall biosynthesis